MELIDTHCHLYGEEFQKDVDAVIERAEKAGVSRFYLPGIDSTAIPSMLALEEKFPGKCVAMMGLHPCYVKENVEEELNTVKEWLSKRNFAAVGEIGLDFYWDRTFEEQQYMAFRKQVTWAKELGLPIVIHSRNATRECIDIIKEYQDGCLRGVFHCFSGDAALAREVVELGFYLGIGGVLTYKNSGLAEAIKEIPSEHLVIETDAPYLSPVPFRGKRNESSYLAHIIGRMAEVKNLSVEEMAGITTSNAKTLFTPTL